MTPLVTLFSLLLLAALTLIAYRVFVPRTPLPTGAGGIIMSIGIFSAFAATELPGYRPVIGQLLALELLILWCLLAYSYLGTLRNGQFRKLHFNPFMHRFTLGTWVAGTAVLATLLLAVFPQYRQLGYGFTLLALLLYIPYVSIFVTGYWQLWRHLSKQQATGVILLATVSTQSLVIATHASLQAAMPEWLGPAIIMTDSLILCSGLLPIAWHYSRQPLSQLADNWSNTNCIIHGAVSITGLAAVLTASFTGGYIIILWCLAACLFMSIESLELVRGWQRIRRYGLRRGILRYDVSQWSRNFTFGMFYAFSFMFLQHLDQLGVQYGWQYLLHGVVTWGQYVTLVLLIIEIALFLSAQARFRHHLAR